MGQGLDKKLLSEEEITTIFGEWDKQKSQEDNSNSMPKMILVDELYCEFCNKTKLSINDSNCLCDCGSEMYVKNSSNYFKI
jgi:hypothetical protein